MATSFSLDAVLGETTATSAQRGVSSWPHTYQVMTEAELIQLIVYRSARHNPRTMPVNEEYSNSAFILHTAAHNQLIYETIPPGSYVMIDPRAEATENSITAYALPEQNTVALGIRDTGWDGYFISFGGRALHITSKRCVPLWPAVAVVGFSLAAV